MQLLCFIRGWLISCPWRRILSTLRWCHDLFLTWAFHFCLQWLPVLKDHNIPSWFLRQSLYTWPEVQVLYHSNTSWCSWAKHLRLQLDFFQANWIKFSSIWKMLVRVSTCKTFSLSILTHQISCRVMLVSHTLTLYTSVGP